MVERGQENGGGLAAERQFRDLLDAYVDGALEDEQLIDALVQLGQVQLGQTVTGAAEGGTAEDAVASKVSELIARVEMIHLNVCHAERRPAIEDVLVDFANRHFA